MNRRVLQIVSLLLLVLMGAAVAHEILPHHSHAATHGEDSSCALCVLLAMTAIAVVVAVCMSPFAITAAPLPHCAAPNSTCFRRIGHPRSPPLQHC